jgi:Fe2+ or Zn2+ uptake regulation protein
MNNSVGNHTESSIIEMIRKAGFRATSQRKSLISFLCKKQYPLSIQEIIAGLSRDISNNRDTVDQVTVYRMIEAFKRAEILREINLHGDRPRYEISDTKNDHHHIVCTKCHKLEDFIGCDYEEIKKKALRKSRSFTKITGHAFDLYGLCASCAK